jgi:hypothetical protein
MARLFKRFLGKGVYLIMFATILRRWRLAAPLALVGMVSILVGAMALTPASAHGSPRFDGWAAGALVHVNTEFSITAADLSACWTGKVSSHHSTQVGPVTGGEPIVLFTEIEQSSHDAQVKVVEFAKCAAEVQINAHKKTSTASATDFGFENNGDGSNGITVFDISVPPFSEDLIILPAVDALNGEAELATTATAHCVKGSAVLSSTIVENSADGTIFVASNGSNTPVKNDLGLSANQVLSGLAGTGYTAVLDEVDTTSNSITAIGLHVFGNGVDVSLAASHASAHC